MLAQEVGQADSVVILEVHFDLDSYRVSKAERQKVDSLLGYFPIQIIEKIDIYGHTDSLAGIDYNKDLSKRRVQSILEFLVLKGLDPRVVKTDHFGEEKPKYDNSPDERFKNRRCELFFYVNTSLLPPPEKRLIDFEFKKGEKVRIPNLQFVANQPIPVWESLEVLKELVEVMYAYPDLVIELQGHVCCNNDMELSVARAQVVHDFLLANGIQKSRVSYKGFSNTKPLFKERTEREELLNRRVEVFIKQNNEQRIKPQFNANIDLRAPVFGVKFFNKNRKLWPSGDFNLELIAEMLRTSEGVHYEFLVFNNINDDRVTSARVQGIQRTLQDKGVSSKTFDVRKVNDFTGIPTTEDENYILVQISEAK